MVYIFLAEGFETVEAMTPIDMCRRAGIDIKTVSITSDLTVKSSHNIPIVTDINISEVDFENADMLILPGGMPGTINLENCEILMEAVKKQYAKGGKISAICAAPRIFGSLGLLAEKRACVYPGMEDYLRGAHVEYNKVSTDGNIITARGMGCAIEFGAAIITALKSEDEAKKVLDAIVY